MPDPLRDHLVKLLRGGSAHVDFDSAIKGLPVALRGKRPKGSPHSPWEIVEHLRIANWDILDFSRDKDYVALKWPDDYWPKTPAPPSATAWAKSVRAFRADLEAICALVSGLIKRNATEMSVTNRRLVIKTGIFSRRTIELLLGRVESIQVQESFAGRMLGFGSVIVHGTGGTPETFHRIAHPLEFRRQMEQQVETHDK